MIVRRFILVSVPLLVFSLTGCMTKSAAPAANVATAASTSTNATGSNSGSSSNPAPPSCTQVASGTAGVPPATVTASTPLLYVGGASCGNSMVAGFVINSDGSLSPTSGSPYATPGSGLAANAQFLFGIDDTNLSTYAIAADGSLNRTANSSLTTGSYVQVMPSGTSLVAALQCSSCNTTLSFYNISSDGTLTPSSSLTAPPDLWPLSFTPDGARAFAPFCYHLGLPMIEGYGVAADSTLSSAGQWDTHGCPTANAVSPDGKYLATALTHFYLETDQFEWLAFYPINSDGSLSGTADVGFQIPAEPNDIKWHPNGQYVAVAGADGVSVYQVSNGSPVLTSGPFGGTVMDHVMFNREATLLFSTSAQSQSLYVFSFNNGVLAPAPGSPYNLGFTTRSLALMH